MSGVTGDIAVDMGITGLPAGSARADVGLLELSVRSGREASLAIVDAALVRVFNAEFNLPFTSAELSMAASCSLVTSLWDTKNSTTWSCSFLIGTISNRHQKDRATQKKYSNYVQYFIKIFLTNETYLHVFFF